MKTSGALGLALAALAAGSLMAPPVLAGEEVRLYTNADLAKYADLAVPATPGTGAAAASRPTFAEDWAFVERHLEREAARLEELRRHQLELDHVAIDEAYDQGRWAGHLALAPFTWWGHDNCPKHPRFPVNPSPHARLRPWPGFETGPRAPFPTTPALPSPRPPVNRVTRPMRAGSR